MSAIARLSSFPTAQAVTKAAPAGAIIPRLDPRRWAGELQGPGRIGDLQPRLLGAAGQPQAGRSQESAQRTAGCRRTRRNGSRAGAVAASRRCSWAAAALVLPFAAAGLELVSTESSYNAHMIRGHLFSSRLSAIVMLSIPVLTVMLHAMRAFAPTRRPGGAGRGRGQLRRGATVFGLSCEGRGHLRGDLMHPGHGPERRSERGGQPLGAEVGGRMARTPLSGARASLDQAAALAALGAPIFGFSSPVR